MKKIFPAVSVAVFLYLEVLVTLFSSSSSLSSSCVFSFYKISKPLLYSFDIKLNIKFLQKPICWWFWFGFVWLV